MADPYLQHMTGSEPLSMEEEVAIAICPNRLLAPVQHALSPPFVDYRVQPVGRGGRQSPSIKGDASNDT